jgi:hypothetical protein
MDKLERIAEMEKQLAALKEEFSAEEKKPIEFLRPLGSITAFCNPGSWDNVTYIGMVHNDIDLDYILAWDDNSEAKVVFIGHWNSGEKE